MFNKLFILCFGYIKCFFFLKYWKKDLNLLNVFSSNSNNLIIFNVVQNHKKNNYFYIKFNLYNLTIEIQNTLFQINFLYSNSEKNFKEKFYIQK